MILLCGECKKWQAESERRGNTHRYGYCPLKCARTKRVHICDMIADKSVMVENKAAPADNAERKKRSAARVLEAVALQEMGFTIPEIAQKMRINKKTVASYIRVHKQKEALENV